jgi:hypothetical protein
MTTPATTLASPTEAEARRTALDVGRRMVGPIWALPRDTFAAGLLAGLAAAAVTLVSGWWVAGLATGLLGGLLALSAAWWDLRDPDLRAALELLSDHECHERAAWRAETGTPMPRRVPAMRSWLTDHPTGPGRASVLLALGRLDAALAEVESTSPKGPDEAFGFEIVRETASLYRRGRPDLDRLRRLWADLPEGREKRHRRECLALVESGVAAVDGGNAVAVLAAARQEIEVHPSMQIERLLARWALVPLVLVIAATGISAVARTG